MEQIEDNPCNCDDIDFQEVVLESEADVAAHGDLFPDIILEPVPCDNEAPPGSEHTGQSTSAAAAAATEEGVRSRQVTLNLEKHALLAPCSCKKGCADDFPEADRENIRQHFWQSQFHGRRSFFSSHITIKPVKRRREKSGQMSEKKETEEEATEKKAKKSRTLEYSLPRNNDGTSTQVCKAMFLHTLGMKTDGMVTSFIHTEKTDLEPFQNGLTED